MAEGYARMAGHVSASSPEKLTLKRNTGIDDCQPGAVQGVDQLLAPWVAEHVGL